MPHRYKAHNKFLLYLAIIYFAMLAASYIVAYKMVSLGIILETGAIFLFPFSFTIADVIAETYGYTISKQLVWASSIGGFLFCLVIEWIVSLHSPKFWQDQRAYSLVLGHILKIYFAMLVASIVGAIVNIRLIIKWKLLMNGRYFWLRSIGSSAIGELLFSVIAGTISFVGVEPANKIFWLMLYGYIFKLIYAVIASFPSNLIVIFLKKYETVSIENLENPFFKGETQS